MRRRRSFREGRRRKPNTGRAPRVAEPTSGTAITEDTAMEQSNAAAFNTSGPTEQLAHQLTDIENFVQHFDHDAVDSDSERWSNLPKLIDLSGFQAENIPEDLFAPQSMETPLYIEDMGDACPKSCQIVLIVFKCGYYAFFTAQCLDHFMARERHDKPSPGICNPTVIQEPYFETYPCDCDFCPVCNKANKSASASIMSPRNWVLPN